MFYYQMYSSCFLRSDEAPRENDVGFEGSSLILSSSIDRMIFRRVESEEIEQ